MSVNEFVVLVICILYSLVAVITLVDLWRFRERARLETALLFLTIGGFSLITILNNSLGSGIMAAVVFSPAAFITLPELRAELPFPLVFLTLISAGSYYFGFVSPHRWLRQVWQKARLQRFIRMMRGRPFSERASSEVKFQELLESIPDAIVIVAHEGQIVMVNEQSTKLFGYEPGELVGQSVECLLPERLRSLHLQHRLGYYTEPRMRPLASDLNLIACRKDGSEFPVEISLSPLHTADGFWVNCIIRDITERNQRKLAVTLREVMRALSRTLDHREVLQTILDQLALVVDYDGANVMLLSGDRLNIVARKSPDDNAERLTEIEFETLPHVQEVLTQKHPVVVANTLLDERWQILPNTDSIRCWLGTPLIVQDKVIGLLNVNKEQPYFYGEEDVEVVQTFAEQAAIAVENSRLYEQAQIELRERIQAEVEAKQRASHLALINDISREIAAIQGLDVVLNKAAQLIQQRFGYHYVALFLLENGGAELKAIAGSYATHFPTKHIQSLEVGIIGRVARWGEKIVANNVNEDPHYTPILRDSTQTQAELCIPIKLGGDTVGVLDVQSPKQGAFTTNDVTTLETLADQIALAVDNARLYEALQAERSSLAHRVSERTAELSAANAELARTARSKDEFLASMSHELRTPLNAILSKADIMEEGIYGPLSEEQVHSLRIIRESGHHLLDLINDILDVAKIEAGKLTLDLSPVSVVSVCDASLRLVKQMAHSKQVEIVAEYDEEVKVIEVDGRRLKQILVNLLSNAVKFTREGGKIGLTVKGNSNSQVAYFSVWDTGIGISPDQMHRLFGEASVPQPFVQLDSSLARQFEGTGLGLSLAYSLAEMHKGSISVESELGKGSRFTVMLPWQLPKAKPEAPVTEQEVVGGITAISATIPSPYKNITILLAEDNETNIEMIQEYLIFEGYHVILARNGYEAIARAEEMKPDLILMDIQMPQMDGLEAIRYIRNKPQFRNMPIIALTALAMPGDRERCLAAGANEYISKPISIKTLMRTIDNQLTQVLT